MCMKNISCVCKIYYIAHDAFHVQKKDLMVRTRRRAQIRNMSDEMRTTHE
jgi:hypothetical protein